ncbi:MAG TPA: PRC-barrel domain-containing protein [Streptosporangiaceae bacterium]|jgi:sporulation protein YlmC with PRC-barrel domain
MPGTEQFTIGAEVSCTDGACGKLSRVVVDPVARVVTHLIVAPRRGHEPARLVPLGLVDSAAAEIQLNCTSAEFGVLDPAEETRFITGDVDVPNYRPTDVVAWPHYGYRGARGALATSDTIPVGEVEVKRGEHVHASDGHIGQVEGLVIDPGSHRVTHVLLQEGHLWGRKDVAIPVSTVTRVTDGIEVSLSKQQVQDLPAVDIDRPQS